MANSIGVVLILIGAIFGAATFYELFQPCANTPLGRLVYPSCDQVLAGAGALGFLGLVFAVTGIVVSAQSEKKEHQFTYTQPSYPPSPPATHLRNAIFCSSCGQSMPQTAIFCPRCGNKNILTP